MVVQQTATRPRSGPVVVPSLGGWGLSAHADLAYRTLALLGPSTSRLLARDLGVEVAPISRALDELVAAGAVRIRAEGRARYWHAVDADQVVSGLRQRRAPQVWSEQLRRHVAAVSSLHLERIPATAVCRLPTRAAARARIAELVAAERGEHLAINTEDVISADAAAAAAPLDRSLVSRGIRVRLLGLTPRDGSHGERLPAGGEYREAASLPLKLMVFDRRAALFPADPANFEAGALLISDPDAVAHLAGLFYTLWGTACDPHQHEVPTVMLSARERAIVSLLIAGHSEAAAATELGLSRRTVVYTLRGLMDRLGVDNRFQLAMILGAARAVPLPNVTPSTTRNTQEP
ncbi:LuxR C-terminal-related transcriptional regulator [Jidongwangia harbinensis]|uniref:LuxR C-terminal-related transcriptional regulator n=1 Tax=Jidongwangia harbinensis TaxID=2878561 RepID=UPI001CDA2B4F|nr:LuxR C-terminal-related transcriptional regulator [Jidongwangia harbinensis]MCA2214127.1 LuxR C-terminal-related transcriptional regulator [Jidongwangia harbinensis]